jgi:hypothetical protein
MRRIGPDMLDRPIARAPGRPGSDDPDRSRRLLSECESSAPRGRCRGSLAGRARRRAPSAPGRSRPYPPPRRERPNRSPRSRHRAIGPLDFLCPVRRNPPARGLAEPAVHKPGLAVLLVAQRPAPERPLAHPEQLSRLLLIEFRRFPTMSFVHVPEQRRPLYSDAVADQRPIIVLDLCVELRAEARRRDRARIPADRRIGFRLGEYDGLGICKLLAARLESRYARARR